MSKATRKPAEDPIVNPKKDLKALFAQRLAATRMQRGWNQSELARQAALHTPDKEFGRALVSMYEQGRQFPSPFNLRALAAALGVRPEDLAPVSLPHIGDPTPQLETKDLGDGMMLLRLNQPVPWEIGIQIMKLLRGTDGSKKS